MEHQVIPSIFYADDDIDDLDFFKEIANEINEPVLLFEEGIKLLDTLKNPPPVASLVFLDLNMPVKSGFDILKEIKSNPDMKIIPVIIYTTSSNPKDIELAKNLGANLYIRKPASISALRKAIDHVLSIDWNNYVASDTQFVYHF